VADVTAPMYVARQRYFVKGQICKKKRADIIKTLNKKDSKYKKNPNSYS
jgi:hypothetical protein